VLTLDANDKATFVGVDVSSVTSAQVKFVQPKAFQMMT